MNFIERVLHFKNKLETSLGYFQNTNREHGCRGNMLEIFKNHTQKAFLSASITRPFTSAHLPKHQGNQ